MKQSIFSDEWWDYTTIDDEIIDDAAKLTVGDIQQLERPGFTVRMYDTFESFLVAEAMEYINTWRRSTETQPAGICGPIGPTEQLPIVAQIVNDLELDIRNGHFWGMDEWYDERVGREVSSEHPLSFAKADMDLCFNRIDEALRMPDANIHFPKADSLESYSNSFDDVRCLVMQGGQGETKHWAFNDPLKRGGDFSDGPPTKEQYRQLKARVVELHPLTLTQNARTSYSGQVSKIPHYALTVGPQETWKSEKVSIWHTGWHDNAFGIRLTALMISKRVADPRVPMSLLADHPNVQFSYYRPAIGEVASEMH